MVETTLVLDHSWWPARRQQVGPQCITGCRRRDCREPPHLQGSGTATSGSAGWIQASDRRKHQQAWRRQIETKIVAKAQLQTSIRIRSRVDIRVVAT
jgi:hypothetical protein